MKLICRTAFAAVALVCSMLPKEALSQYYYDDFIPYGMNRWATKAIPSNGQGAGQWASWANQPDKMTIFWSSGTSFNNFDWMNAEPEEFEIRRNCSDGQSYAFLNGYIERHNGQNTGRVWWIKPVKVTITTADTNTFDITQISSHAPCRKVVSNINGSGISSEVGIPYAPYQLWGQSYVFKVWGVIAGSNGIFDRRFYWQARYEPISNKHNPCWIGAAPSTRPTLVQKEAYWDQWTGWAIGSGTVGSDGWPVGNDVVYGRYDGAGMNAGPSWIQGAVQANGNLGPVGACIRNTYPY